MRTDGDIPYAAIDRSELFQGITPGGSEPADAEPQLPRPVSGDERTTNPLRPSSFEEVIGQEKAVKMMQRVVQASRQREQVLDHILLIGASGTGKSTFSHVISNELDVRCFEVEAPVSHETLLAFREAMQPGEILRIEEIHQQAIMERRGQGAGTEPEVLYNVLEDRTIVAGSEILPFPEITVVGTTTDEGMLPDAFVNRFPLRPKLEPYTVEQLAIMAIWNAQRLGLSISKEAALTLAGASRGVPRQLNNYMKNAALLAMDGMVVVDVAEEVLHDLNGVTNDGLTGDMQGMLTFIYTRGRHESAKGEVVYRAGLGTIATALGKSRDAKSISLRVEPYLIQRGFIQLGSGGRVLTDEGIQRARELLGEEDDDA